MHIRTITETCDTIPHTNCNSLTKHRKLQYSWYFSVLGANSAQIQGSFNTNYYKGSHPVILPMSVQIRHLMPNHKPGRVYSSPKSGIHWCLCHICMKSARHFLISVKWLLHRRWMVVNFRMFLGSSSLCFFYCINHWDEKKRKKEKRRK